MYPSVRDIIYAYAYLPFFIHIIYIYWKIYIILKEKESLEQQATPFSLIN